MRSVSIIGPGRVGGALAASLPSGKYRIDTIVYRSSPRISTSPAMRRISIDSLDTLTSDIIFITTQDAEIAPTARRLSSRLTGNATVFHTSGALSSAELSSLKDAGFAVGSIHPLVSISDATLGPERFRGSYFCVEGDAEAAALGEVIVSDLGGRAVYDSSTEVGVIGFDARRRSLAGARRR